MSMAEKQDIVTMVLEFALVIMVVVETVVANTIKLAVGQPGRGHHRTSLRMDRQLAVRVRVLVQEQELARQLVSRMLIP